MTTQLSFTLFVLGSMTSSLAVSLTTPSSTLLLITFSLLEIFSSVGFSLVVAQADKSNRLIINVVNFLTMTIGAGLIKHCSIVSKLNQKFQLHACIVVTGCVHNYVLLRGSWVYEILL